ncbi:hypothetical protein RhiJN_10249 [Ceratobasidium sp. AG-Ba]|nr:hypothetical protein RhiJN_10249 [Ceratobasidium sp. AG-Ba]QRW11002.1 hypothetical protein RhiLY_10001 [Ceratobasidium sp. AG-Ba]
MFEYDCPHVVIKKEKLQEPLFRAKTARGLELSDKPAMNPSLLMLFIRIARAIGLPFGLILGNEVARRLLSHAEGLTVYEGHYSKFDNLAPAVNQHGLNIQRNKNVIVDAMLSLSIESAPDLDASERQQEAI